MARLPDVRGARAPRILVLAVVLAIAGSWTSPATASSGSAARTPQVVFEQVTSKCSSYEVDGQEQVQCQAAFTTTASKVDAGYTITILQAKQGSVAQRTVGTFKAKGTSASRRWTGQVCSFGAARKPVKLRFFAIVKDSSGDRVLRTTPHALC